MVRSKKQRLLLNGKQLDRQKQMMLLMDRYSTMIFWPTTFILPYVWSFYYRHLEDDDTRHKEFIVHTNNAAFAAMIFEAQQLPQMIIITGMAIVGIEQEIEKIVFAKPLTSDSL